MVPWWNLSLLLSLNRSLVCFPLVYDEQVEELTFGRDQSGAESYGVFNPHVCLSPRCCLSYGSINSQRIMKSY